MAIGATGAISVLSNLLPGKVKGIAKNCLVGKYAEARRIHDQVFPMVKAIFLDGNPVGIKYAMKLAGMDSGELRLPLWEASEGTKRRTPPVQVSWRRVSTTLKSSRSNR